MQQKRYKIATLGCRTNQYESQSFRQQLESLGFKPAQEGEEADVCIVNTCTVTHGADRGSRSSIRRLIRENPRAKIAVTGCMVESEPDLLKSLPGITHLVPNQSKEQLIEKLLPGYESYPEFVIDHFDAHTRAFVKVQDGCNSFCTYCVIPYVRGRSRSRTIPEIIREIEGLVRGGYREVVLTGINIGDFDGDDKKTLADLVREVDQIDGLDRLRISSIDPDEVDDELASAVLEGKRTCASMHIVLQAGSNVTLKRMNRKYTRQLFLRTVEGLRRASPDFTCTTDVIVGFPGESERDFEETLEVIEEVQFAKVHMFPYSKRPRTRAALYKDHLPQVVIGRRKARALSFAERQAFALRDRFVGREMTVLTESGSFGHTDNFLGVSIDGGSLETNQLIRVKMYANSPSGLLGRVVGCASK